MLELSRRPTRSILAVAYVGAMLTALPAAADAQYSPIRVTRREVLPKYSPPAAM